MSKTRKKYQEKEERRHPDSPDGLVVAASKNRAFAERFVGKTGTDSGRGEAWASLS